MPPNKQAFIAIAGLPGVVGVIDGTRVHICGSCLAGDLNGGLHRSPGSKELMLVNLLSPRIAASHTRHSCVKGRNDVLTCQTMTCQVYVFPCSVIPGQNFPLKTPLFSSPSCVNSSTALLSISPFLLFLMSVVVILLKSNVFTGMTVIYLYNLIESF